MKKKGRWKQLGPALFALAIGAFGGLVIVGCLETEEMAQNSFLEDMGVFAILLLVFCASMYLQIIIHEAGHLIFGLLSGYRFSSFRIGNMIWKKVYETLFASCAKTYPYPGDIEGERELMEIAKKYTSEN